MVCYCKCWGRKLSELLQTSPWKVTFQCPVTHLCSNFRRFKEPAQGEHPRRATNNGRGWFSRSREEEETHHRRNHRNFKESCSADQNVDRLKHPSQGSRHPKFFAPLRAADMDTDTSDTEASSNEETVPSKTGRLPPIILTSTTNLIQL
jgi:hypothetical protein